MEGLDGSLWNPARQCTATSRSGERCRRQPIPGGSVCVMHGGSAPAVKKSARARLLEGADIAIDTLLDLLRWRPPCEHCGRSNVDDHVLVRTCQVILDRSGFHPSVTVQHTEAPDKYEGLTLDETIEHLERLLDDARALRDADVDHERARLQIVAVDASVIDDDAELLELLEGDEAPPLNGAPEQPAPSIQDGSVNFPRGNCTPPDDEAAK